jgi:hypothetical protein
MLMTTNPEEMWRLPKAILKALCWFTLARYLDLDRSRVFTVSFLAKLRELEISGQELIEAAEDKDAAQFQEWMEQPRWGLERIFEYFALLPGEALETRADWSYARGAVQMDPCTAEYWWARGCINGEMERTRHLEEKGRWEAAEEEFPGCIPMVDPRCWWDPNTRPDMDVRVKKDRSPNCPWQKEEKETQATGAGDKMSGQPTRKRKSNGKVTGSS